MPTIKVRKYADSVYIIYCHKNKIFKVFTGVKVQDKFWNKSTPKKNCPYFTNVVTQIDAMEARVLNASMAVRARGQDPTIELVRKEFHQQLSKVKEKKPFWEIYREYLSLLACKESSKKKIGMTYKVLEYYCEWTKYKFDIETFDKIGFARFIKYLTEHQHMADSTINRHVRMLKTFLKFAYPQKDITWMKYSLLSAEEEVIALTENELKYLIDAVLDGYLAKARDLFVFLATTGMRHCDSQLFNSTWVSEERILEFTQLKTGGKAYPPLYEVSRRILMKYEGKPPQLSNQKLNQNLKELFRKLNMKRPVTKQTIKAKVVHREVLPLYSVISSHTARRTFITLCLQKDMPIQDVMKMSGHSDYKSMRPYMRVTHKHLRDIADRWEI